MTTTGGPDALRVAEIGKYRVLVEPPRADLLALVEIAAQVAQVPMATINLITDSEQHQIATHGFDASVCTPRGLDVQRGPRRRRTGDRAGRQRSTPGSATTRSSPG